jgi:hypothetical protein
MNRVVRVELPAHLRTLAVVGSHEVTVTVADPVTTAGILDALEAAHPVLAGTMRDHVTGKRRAFIRFFGCGQDLSLRSADEPLPEAIADGREPLLIVGAIAGG